MSIIILILRQCARKLSDLRKRFILIYQTDAHYSEILCSLPGYRKM